MYKEWGGGGGEGPPLHATDIYKKKPQFLRMHICKLLI